MFKNYIIAPNRMHNLWTNLHEEFQGKAFVTSLMETFLLKVQPSRKTYKLINISKWISSLVFPCKQKLMFYLQKQ